MRPSMLALGALLLLAAAPAGAQVPETISYQGVLTDDQGDLVPDGPYDLTFRLYDTSTGGTALWTEAHLGIPVLQGGFSVLLGSLVPLALPFDLPYWLEVQVGSDPALAPRVPLASSPYGLSLRTPFTDVDSTVTPLVTLHNKGSSADLRTRKRLDVGTDLVQGQFNLWNGTTPLTVIRALGFPAGGNVTSFDEAGNWLWFGTSDLHGEGGYFFLGGNAAGSTGLVIDGNVGGSGEPAINLYGVSSSVVLDVGAPGDSSVRLPSGAISAAEVLDEPGVAANTSNASVGLSGGVQTALLRTIVAPADGYVLAIATAQANLTHTSGTGSVLTLGVSTTAGTFPANQDVAIGLPSNLPTGTYSLPATVQSIFQVAAGFVTVYFLAQEGLAPASLNDLQLSVVYFPSSHGVVSPPAPPVAASPEQDDALAPMQAALTPGEIAQELNESETLQAGRVRRELDGMRMRLDALRAELTAMVRAQGAGAVKP